MTIRKIIGVLSSGAVMAACASAPPPPPKKVAPKKVTQVKPKDPLQDANQKFEKGDWKAALGAYDALLQKDPANPTARFNRAVTLQKLGQNDKAKAAFSQLVSEDPNNASAVVNLGALLREEGKSKEAIKLYTKYLKQDPFESRVLNNLSVLYREQKDYPKAIKSIRTLLKRDQGNIPAYKNLALIYYDQKKFRLSQTILGNAIQMAEKQSVKDPDIYVNLGLTHLALGKKENALVSFKEAASLDPQHIVANFNIGAIALEHRDYALAEKSFGVAVTKYKDDFKTNAALGFALQGLQKYDDAIQQLERANTIKSGDDQVLLQIVIIHQAKNDPDKAIEAARRYMKIKNITCSEEDFDGFCGRYNGIVMMKQMADAPPEAPPAEDKPKNDGSVELFTGEEEPPAEGAPAEGEAAPAEGEAPPAEGQPEGAGEAPPPAEGSGEKKAEEAPSKGGGDEAKPK